MTHPPGDGSIPATDAPLNTAKAKSCQACWRGSLLNKLPGFSLASDMVKSGWSLNALHIVYIHMYVYIYIYTYYTMWIALNNLILSNIWDVWSREDTPILSEKLWKDDETAVELMVLYFQKKAYLWSSLVCKKMKDQIRGIFAGWLSVRESVDSFN